jgi:hypothetical protein
MITMTDVTQALLSAGECQATERASGFRVRAVNAHTVIVRWHTPDDNPNAGAGLRFLEEYACLLRDVGIPALVTTDANGPHVLCSLGRVLSQRIAKQTSLRDAS